MDAKTLSFGKNGEEPRVAFENIGSTELYPCVMFYSTNPGEKVKITDMRVQGTQKDLLPGEPDLAPLYAVLSEAYISVIRKLHNSTTWTEDVNTALFTRLAKIETLLPTMETHNVDSNSDLKSDKTSKSKFEINIQELRVNVWPSLVVIGGLDRGLRMGGYCKHKNTGQRAIVLGILKKGITTVNIQWENDGSVSDVALSNLEFVDPIPFDCAKFNAITPKILLQIARLSGITNETSFPTYELTDDEEMLLNLHTSKNEKSGSFDSKGVHCNSDSQLPNQCLIHERPKTMESLTNEMVSSIMGEVKRLSTEKIVASQSESAIKETKEIREKHELSTLETKILRKKLLTVEGECLQLAFLQFAALKVLGVFLISTPLTQLLLANDKKLKTEDIDCIREVMHAVVDKSIAQCKLKKIISIAELERAETVLHLSYIKNVCSEGSNDNGAFTYNYNLEGSSSDCFPPTTSSNETSCISGTNVYSKYHSINLDNSLSRATLTVQSSPTTHGSAFTTALGNVTFFLAFHTF